LTMLPLEVPVSVWSLAVKHLPEPLADAPGLWPAALAVVLTRATESNELLAALFDSLESVAATDRAARVLVEGDLGGTALLSHARLRLVGAWPANLSATRLHKLLTRAPKRWEDDGEKKSGAKYLEFAAAAAQYLAAASDAASPSPLEPAKLRPFFLEEDQGSFAGMRALARLPRAPSTTEVAEVQRLAINMVAKGEELQALYACSGGKKCAPLCAVAIATVAGKMAERRNAAEAEAMPPSAVAAYRDALVSALDGLGVDGVLFVAVLYGGSDAPITRAEELPSGFGAKTLGKRKSLPQVLRLALVQHLAALAWAPLARGLTLSRRGLLRSVLEKQLFVDSLLKRTKEPHRLALLLALLRGTRYPKEAETQEWSKFQRMVAGPLRTVLAESRGALTGRAGGGELWTDGEFHSELAGRKLPPPERFSLEGVLAEKGNLPSTWRNLLASGRLSLAQIMANLRSIVMLGIEPKLVASALGVGGADEDSSTATQRQKRPQLSTLQILEISQRLSEEFSGANLKKLEDMREVQVTTLEQSDRKHLEVLLGVNAKLYPSESTQRTTKAKKEDEWRSPRRDPRTAITIARKVDNTATDATVVENAVRVLEKSLAQREFPPELHLRRVQLPDRVFKDKKGTSHSRSAERWVSSDAENTAKRVLELLGELAGASMEREALPNREGRTAGVCLTPELMRNVPRFGQPPTMPKGFLGAATRRLLWRGEVLSLRQEAAAHGDDSVGKSIVTGVSWCEKERGEGGRAVDLDLSIHLVDASYDKLASCDYSHVHGIKGCTYSGDETSAPFPNGARETMTLNADEVRQHYPSARYAFICINNFSKQDFDTLEEADAFFAVVEKGEAATDPDNWLENYTPIGSGRITPIASTHISGRGTLNVAAVITLGSEGAFQEFTVIDASLNVTNMQAASQFGLVIDEVKRATDETLRRERLQLVDVAVAHAALCARRIVGLIPGGGEAVVVEQAAQGETIAGFRARALEELQTAAEKAADAADGAVTKPPSLTAAQGGGGGAEAVVVFGGELDDPLALADANADAPLFAFVRLRADGAPRTQTLSLPHKTNRAVVVHAVGKDAGFEQLKEELLAER